jgi:hypothetical protein
VSALLEEGRRSAAKSVNAVLTATYWLIGKRIVDYEQGGQERAAYGSELLKRLSADLGGRFGRGFSERNLEQMRLFYLHWANPQTPSATLGRRSPRAIFGDILCEIRRPGCACLPAFLVALSATAFRARAGCEEALRRGGFTRSLICSTTGSSNRNPLFSPLSPRRGQRRARRAC